MGPAGSGLAAYGGLAPYATTTVRAEAQTAAAVEIGQHANQNPGQGPAPPLTAPRRRQQQCRLDCGNQSQRPKHAPEGTLQGKGPVTYLHTWFMHSQFIVMRRKPTASLQTDLGPRRIERVFSGWDLR